MPYYRPYPTRMKYNNYGKKKIVAQGKYILIVRVLSMLFDWPREKSQAHVAVSHSILPFYRCPSRRSRTYHLHKSIHVGLGDAINVDAVPISAHDEDNVLCVSFRSSTVLGMTSGHQKWSMRGKGVTRNVHHPRVQFCPYEFGSGQEWYPTDDCHREGIEAPRASLSRCQDFDLHGSG